MASQAFRASPGWVSAALKRGELRLAVVGLGRIGLPTAALFAQAGANVVGLDISSEVVDSVNAGRSHLVDEPGLSEVVTATVSSGRLRATTDFSKAIGHSDFVIVSVPTPVNESKSPDYSAIRSASRSIGRALQSGTVVIVESTVGPGTVEETIQPILERESGLRLGKDFGVASCPERSDPGSILKNMATVPRIVGAADERWRETVAELYGAALGVEIVKVRNPKTANAVKLTENLFRDVNIALANEFALLYEKLGIDVIEVIKACSTKYNFLPHYPGAGVGGPCLVGDEFVYILDEGGLQVTRIADYVDGLRQKGLVDVEVSNGGSILFPKRDVRALSFSDEGTVFEKVRWFSVREHAGRVLRLRLSSNRQITVTPDHPVIVRSDTGLAIKRADSLGVNDEVPLSRNLPRAFEGSEGVDLIEELLRTGKIPASKVKVKPLDLRLRDHLGTVGKIMREVGISRRERHEFYRWNYITLDKFLEIEPLLPDLFSRDRLALYTGRGSTCMTPASFLKDASFWRFVGYYLSEGCRYSENAKRGVRDIVKISFGAHEKELIADCRCIVDRWGLHYSENIREGCHSLRISSRIFGLLFDYLDCGTNAYDKKLPIAIFGSSNENVAAVLQGLFRGDGWLEFDPRKKGLSLGYATVSPALFQGALLLLQRFGIVPTLRLIVSRKSKVPALALRVSRYEDLAIFDHEVGGNARLSQSLLEHPKMLKRSPALRNYGTFATAFVKSIENLEFKGKVYNMEVDDSHTFVSSYGIITHNCLPSNPYYLISEGVKVGNIPYLVRLAREINDRMPDHVVELVMEALNDIGKTVSGSRIALLGVAYKPEVRDVQLSPIARVASRLLEMGARLEIYDPYFVGEKVFAIDASRTIEEAVRGADCVVVGTAHSEFKRLAPKRLAAMTQKLSAVVDARNVFDPDEVTASGMKFIGIGRKVSG